MIKKQNYICITADVWSGNNKSYMGMYDIYESIAICNQTFI